MEPSFRTLHSFLKEIAEKHPDKLLLSASDGRLGAREVCNQVESAAADLNLRGITAGDYVAVRTRRTRQTAILILALQRIGAVAVLTDSRLEPEAFLRNCEISLPLKLAVDPGTFSFPDRLLSELPEPNPKAPGFLIFTSGSTGKPKAVMLSQYNLVNNLLDSQPLGCYREDDIALGVLPMDHVFGLVLLAGVCVLGYSLCFPEKTDTTSILSAIERERITRMNGVPSLYLVMAERAKEYDLSSLRAGFIGGGPCTPEQFRSIEELLEMTLIPVYGMSECVGIACGNHLDTQAKRSSGVGPFYSMNTGRILLEDGSEAAPGEVGEIFVTGPSRMVGYYPDVMPEDALLPTGDLGYLSEDETLHLTGRKKDIIIRNGNNLSTRRIEEAILSIPGIRAACVIGLPHPIQGEIPCAMVVGERSETELLALLQKLVPKNQIPAKICSVESIPLTASGKADKRKIREVLLSWNP